MNNSPVICQENFGLLWGQKLISTTRALHDMKYSPKARGEGEEEDEYEPGNNRDRHCEDDDCRCHDYGYHCHDDEQMNMILKRTISREEVKGMPKAASLGQIHVIQTESEAEKTVAYLQSQAILGIDSEIRPSLTKGHSHKVTLLQISSGECCLLFCLNMIRPT